MFKVNEEEPDEDLDYYWFNLGKDNRKKLKQAEEIKRSKWNMKVLLDETFEKFKDEKSISSRFGGDSVNVNQSMKGVFCYDIL